MTSLGTIKRIAPLVGTKDLTEWETKFVRDMDSLTSNGAITTALSPKQVEIVERIHSRHFG